MIILALFIILQVLDGVFTYIGVAHSILGVHYEDNPVIIYSITKLGNIFGLIVPKTLAIAGGLLLYHYRKEKSGRTIIALALVTGLYLFAAEHNVRTLWFLFNNNELNF